MMEDTLDELFRRSNDESDDRKKIPLLHECAVHALNRDAPRALAAAEEVVRLSVACGDRQYEARGLLLSGRALCTMARYNDSVQAFGRARALFAELGDRVMTARALSDCGGAYAGYGDFPAAFPLLNDALAVAEEVQDDVLAGMTLNRLGYVWERLGDHMQALGYWQRCRAVAERCDNEGLRSGVSNNIANLYLELGEKERAMECFRYNLERAVERGDLYREALSRVNIAEIFQSQRQFDHALDYQQQALALARRLNNPRIEVVVLSNIGHTLEKTGQLTEALLYQEQALALTRRLGYIDDHERILLRLGVLYRKAGRYDSAIEVLRQARSKAAEAGSDLLQSKACKQLAATYEHLGDSRRALEEFRCFMHFRRLYLHSNRQRMVEQVRMRAEVAQAVRDKEFYQQQHHELAEALQRVEALTEHYRALNREQTLLIDSVTQTLRAPFKAVASYLPQVRARYAAGDTPAVRDSLADMEQYARSASRTVDRLLMAHALESGKFTPVPEQVDVVQLVRSTLANYNGLIDRMAVAVEYTETATPLYATADPYALREILGVLVHNAVRFSPAGGRLRIESTCCDDAVCMSVGDSGPGLDDDLAHALTAPSDERLNALLPSGSGLRLVRDLVLLMDGRLLYRHTAEGTTITVCMPLAAEPVL